MTLEASGLLEDSAAVGGGGGGGGATIAAAENLKNLEGGDGVSAPEVPDGFEEEERVRGEEGDRNLTGNRWPRDETLALLKVRSEMDVAFRESTLKAPLWDEISRKLAELGYHRSAKKCKEKFENIYKYHKRTKECRSRRRNGKSYRFFEQLEHLDNQSSLPSPSQNKIQSSTTETSMEMGLEPRVMTMADMVIKPSSVTQDVAINPCSIPNSSAELFVMSTSTSATSSSGKESQGSGKKKRKLADYFRSLMNEVLEKQENLQNKFIEALEKCERDRIAREEAWKTQELARIKREQELLAQERDIVAAKDAAVIAFLQKISEQGSPVQFPENQTPSPNPIPTPIPIPNPNPIPNPIPCEKTTKKQENGIAENSSQQVSSSRWPKVEVEALIKLRTNLDTQYQDNGAKGPLWEEISSSMKKLGYNRNAKRCKEKWENINKYYKRVKDGNKRRPEDSKTCPYFHILESLYEKKSKKVEFLDSSGSNLKPEHILMQMIGQQQQQQQQEQRPESVTEEDGESENVDQNQEDDDEEDDDNGDDYQIVVNNNPASVTNMK